MASRRRRSPDPARCVSSRRPRRYWRRIVRYIPVSLHEQLYQCTAQGGLDASSARRLHALAGVGAAPADLQQRLRRGAGWLAAGLIGFGVVMWVAANWHELGRPMRFGLLQALLLSTLLGALARPVWRAALGLLALLTLGALLALLGQTYQTGADAWQLFALWAGLSFPLVGAIRSDLLWTPWTLITLTAVGQWMHTYAGRSWAIQADSLPVHAIAFALAGLLCGALSRPGVAAPWAWRLAVLLGVGLVGGAAMAGLVASPLAPQFALGLGLLLAAFAVAWWRREVYAMCLLALAIDALLVVSVLRFQVDLRSDPLASYALITLVAMVVLAGSVSLILRRMRAEPQA